MSAHGSAGQGGGGLPGPGDAEAPSPSTGVSPRTWLIGGLVLIVALVVVLTVVVPALDRGDEAGPASGADSAGEPTSAGGDEVANGGEPVSPQWDTPDLAAGWTVTADEETLWTAEHEGGCSVEAATMSLYGAGSAADDDAAMTEADLAAYLEERRAEADDAEHDIDSVDDVQLPGPDGDVDFAVSYVGRTGSDGEADIEIWYWHSFVDEGTSMYAYLSCASGDVGRSMIEETLGSLAVR